MGLAPPLQTKLYEQHWRPMELAFGQEAYATQFDGFMRNYLTMKTGEIARVEDVYDAFKTYARSHIKDGGSISTLVADIHRFARFFCRLALGQEGPDKALNEAFSDIRDLKAEVTFPFLLELCADHESKLLSPAELLSVLRMIESYIFRRVICSIPTNSHNRTFSTFARAIDKARYLDSVKAHFLTLPSYRRLPDDREFGTAMKTRDLYNTRIRSYWLRRIENHDRKERVAVEEYTIEHILPQKDELPEAWKAALGPSWQAIRDNYLHTLGNLTLTAYNSELSARPFVEKRDMKGGFKTSPLVLNEGLGSKETWNEEAILERAERLLGLANTVWAAPKLDDATLASFSKKPKVPGTYGIGDHPPLANGPIAELFQSLRTQFMALNPAVTEDFKQLYVVYKAEEVFVSLIPRFDKLRLVLNIPFPELQDTRGLCRDVTNIGHWSSGDVDLDVTPASDLAYVLGLMRQAFEWQLDGVSRTRFPDWRRGAV